MNGPTSLLLVMALLLLACEPAPTTSDPAPAEVADIEPKKQEPPQREELKKLVSSVERFVKLQEAYQNFEMVDNGKGLTREWAENRYQDNQSVVSLIGTRAGFPGYAVSRPDSAVRMSVIVLEDRVLSGRSDFAVFLSKIERDDALAWATGWLMLWRGLPREPLGYWSTPRAEPPRWTDAGLELTFKDARGRRRSVLVREQPGHWPSVDL